MLDSEAETKSANVRPKRFHGASPDTHCSHLYCVVFESISVWKENIGLKFYFFNWQSIKSYSRFDVKQTGILFWGETVYICVKWFVITMFQYSLWLRTEAPSRRLSLARSGKEATIDRARACVVMNLLKNKHFHTCLRIYFWINQIFM